MGANSISREDLQLVRAGDPIMARAFNALIEFVKSEQNPGRRGRYEEQTGFVDREMDKRKQMWVRAESLNDVPPFGIVQVYNGLIFNDGILRFQVCQAVANAQVYAGNEDYELKTGKVGWVRLITPYDPVFCTYYGGRPSWLQQLTVNGLQVQAGNGGQLLCMAGVDSLGPQDQVGVTSLPGAPVLIGQTTTTHVKGQTKTVNVYRGAIKGLETFALGDTIQAYNRFATMGPGKWVACTFINEGWELSAGEC